MSQLKQKEHITGLLSVTFFFFFLFNSLVLRFHFVFLFCFVFVLLLRLRSDIILKGKKPATYHVALVSVQCNHVHLSTKADSAALGAQQNMRVTYDIYAPCIQATVKTVESTG